MKKFSKSLNFRYQQILPLPPLTRVGGSEINFAISAPTFQYVTKTRHLVSHEGLRRQTFPAIGELLTGV
jgi:hypothetical protein